jgi:hypothetical protein
MVSSAVQVECEGQEMARSLLAIRCSSSSAWLDGVKVTEKESPETAFFVVTASESGQEAG